MIVKYLNMGGIYIANIFLIIGIKWQSIVKDKLSAC